MCMYMCVSMCGEGLGGHVRCTGCVFREPRVHSVVSNCRLPRFFLSLSLLCEYGCVERSCRSQFGSLVPSCAACASSLVTPAPHPQPRVASRVSPTLRDAWSTGPPPPRDERNNRLSDPAFSPMAPSRPRIVVSTSSRSVPTKREGGGVGGGGGGGASPSRPSSSSGTRRRGPAVVGPQRGAQASPTGAVAPSSSLQRLYVGECVVHPCTVLLATAAECVVHPCTCVCGCCWQLLPALHKAAPHLSHTFVCECVVHSRSCVCGVAVRCNGCLRCTKPRFIPPPPFRRTPPMIMAGGSGASPSRTPSRIGSAAPRLAGSGPSSAATLPQAVFIPTGHPSAHRDPSSGKGHAAPNGGSVRRADGGGSGGGRGAGAGRRPELLPYTTAACAPGPIGGGASAAWA
jgi:hypothetical protein